MLQHLDSQGGVIPFRDINFYFAFGNFSCSQSQADGQAIVSPGLRAGTGVRNYLTTPALPAFCKTISEQQRLGWVFWLGRRASEGSEQAGDKRMPEAGWCCGLLKGMAGGSDQTS